MASLIRYWFEFDSTAPSAARLTPWWGVTAWTVEDARGLILGTTRFGQSLPPVTRLIEDVDVSTLDQEHVARNMLAPNRVCDPADWATCRTRSGAPRQGGSTGEFEPVELLFIRSR